MAGAVKNVDVIKDFDLGTLSKTDQEEAVNSIITLLQDRVVDRIKELLTVEEQKELATIMESKDEQKTMEYIVSHVAEIDAITFREYEALKSESLTYKELAKKDLENYRKELLKKSQARN